MFNKENAINDIVKDILNGQTVNNINLDYIIEHYGYEDLLKLNEGLLINRNDDDKQLELIKEYEETIINNIKWYVGVYIDGILERNESEFKLNTYGDE